MHLVPVCVFGRSYLCLVVSCLGSCVCVAMLRVEDQFWVESLLSWKTVYIYKRRLIGCLMLGELG